MIGPDPVPCPACWKGAPPVGPPGDLPAAEPDPLAVRPEPSRWRATATTFGPTVKVLVTLVLVVLPAGVLVHDLAAGEYVPGPSSALDLLVNGLAATVAVWVVRRMWRPGGGD